MSPQPSPPLSPPPPHTHTHTRRLEEKKDEKIKNKNTYVTTKCLVHNKDSIPTYHPYYPEGYGPNRLTTRILGPPHRRNFRTAPTDGDSAFSEKRQKRARTIMLIRGDEVLWLLSFLVDPSDVVASLESPWNQHWRWPESGIRADSGWELVKFGQANISLGSRNTKTNSKSRTCRHLVQFC